MHSVKVAHVYSYCVQTGYLDVMLDVDCYIYLMNERINYLQDFYFVVSVFMLFFRFFLYLFIISACKLGGEPNQAANVSALQQPI